MGKTTISMVIFNSYVSHYQRVHSVHFCVGPSWRHGPVVGRKPRRTPLDCDALWGWQTEDVASAAWLSGSVNRLYYVVTMLYYYYVVPYLWKLWNGIIIGYNIYIYTYIFQRATVYSGGVPADTPLSSCFWKALLKPVLAKCYGNNRRTKLPILWSFESGRLEHIAENIWCSGSPFAVGSHLSTGLLWSRILEAWSPFEEPWGWQTEVSEAGASFATASKWFQDAPVWLTGQDQKTACISLTSKIKDGLPLQDCCEEAGRDVGITPLCCSSARTNCPTASLSGSCREKDLIDFIATICWNGFGLACSKVSSAIALQESPGKGKAAQS